MDSSLKKTDLEKKNDASKRCTLDACNFCVTNRTVVMDTDGKIIAYNSNCKNLQKSRLVSLF